MAQRLRIVCQCGGQLPRPVPRVCPHCGAAITTLRSSSWPWVWQVLSVAAVFGLLVGFLCWLLHR